MFSRRRFLRSSLMGTAALSFGPAFWRNALAAAPAARSAVGPYGALLAADANGIMLPPGFSSRVIARSLTPVGTTGYVFPIFPDGAATFGTPDGGWILAINSEVPTVGGASGIRFAADGTVTDAYRILENTSTNCAGGPTPWGTWLSCEEVEDGLVWECDPTGATKAIARPALGRFKHEAACVDPDREQLYLSEDVNGGGLYRFTPDVYPDLSAGILEIACDGGGGRVAWRRVGTQGESALPFARGEGIWFDEGIVYLATTSDETIHAYDTAKERIEVIYRADDVPDTPLRGVDNVHVSRSGDLFVAEDSYTNDPDAMDVCLITPDREVSRFLKLVGPEHKLPGELESETVGLCFDPSGERLYVGSQRAFGVGVVYEITGPFRSSRPVTAMPGVPVGLEVTKRLQLRRFLRRGLAVAITVDAPATAHLTLTARINGRRVVIGRATRPLERGPQVFRLRARGRRRKLLRDRRTGLTVRLDVRLVTPGAPDRRLRRSVRLTRRARKASV